MLLFLSLTSPTLSDPGVASCLLHSFCDLLCLIKTRLIFQLTLEIFSKFIFQLILVYIKQKKKKPTKKPTLPSAIRENNFVKTLLKDSRLEFLMLKYSEKCYIRFQLGCLEDLVQKCSPDNNNVYRFCIKINSPNPFSTWLEQIHVCLYWWWLK